MSVIIHSMIRNATRHDVVRLAAMLGDYMRGTYHGEWGGNVRLLEQHLAEKDVEILVAETAAGEITGFLAWAACYDLHWCMKGAMIIDLYVCPAKRGRGLAVLLSINLAKEVERRGGTFMKGGPVEDQAVHRLYGR